MKLSEVREHTAKLQQQESKHSRYDNLSKLQRPQSHKNITKLVPIQIWKLGMILCFAQSLLNISPHWVGAAQEEANHF